MKKKILLHVVYAFSLMCMLAVLISNVMNEGVH